MSATDVRRIAASEARPLRWAVLRPHQPPEACVYPGDDDPRTLHLGAFEGGPLAGVASMYAEPPEGRDEPHAWRLRGMATLPDARGRGHGRALVEACAAHAEARGGTLLWCNARATAGGFYLRLGFTRLGDEYDLPGLGPHWLMERRLDPDRASRQAP